MDKYSQTLDFLYNQLPMFQNSGPGAYKPGLDNALQLAELFGNPHKKLNNAIHIAGTNGKGSTAHTIAAILQAQGYRTALYTSPHLADFRERIRINGQMIPKEEVINFVERFRALKTSLAPSFFELTTIMAFEWFANRQTDFTIIETGLGGRLDTTNIIAPIISVITNISPDHTALLGDTPAQIAAEKAGIIKPQTPVVIGTASTDTKPVFISKAALENAPIVFASEQDEIISATHSADSWFYKSKTFGSFSGQLAGDCQRENTGTVLEVLKQLRGMSITVPDSAIHSGFANVTSLTGLAGRWQTVNNAPPAVADTGHNIGGWKWLARQIANVQAPTRHLILGFVNDKDISSILSLIKTIPDTSITFTQASVNRALPAETLAARAAELGITGIVEPSVAEAYKKTLEKALPSDFIFIGGSTFVVADLLASR